MAAPTGSLERSRSSGPVIPVRRVDLELDPETLPLDYYGNDAHLTLMWNALSVLFPEGERFFVDSVRRFRDRINDPELAASIVAFVGQEAMHSKEHAVLTKVLEKQGVAAAMAADRRVARILKLVRRVVPPKGQLAATCALEHFTALLAEQLLRNERYQEMLDEKARGLWCWHALEELEHKTVAFDVYKAVGGSYVRRVAVMVMTTVIFFAVTAGVYVAMLRERGRLTDLRGLARYLSHFWGRRGFFSSLAPAYFAYYKPGFHPNDRDTRELVAERSERLFGEQGVMREQLKNVRRPNDSAPRAA
jgi:uncharacterized protein